MGKTNKRRTNNDAQISSLEQQLKSTAEKLADGTIHIEQLHRHWRTYLICLCALVVSMTLYQIQQQVTQCVGHMERVGMKPSGDNDDGSSAWWWIQSSTTTTLVALHCGPLLIGCVMTIFLWLHLQRTRNLLHPFLLISEICLVPLFAMYYLHIQQSREREGLSTCLDNDKHIQELMTDSAIDKQQPVFPVAVVLQCIAVFSLWFMKYQRSKHMYHVDSIAKVQTDMANKRGKKKQ